MDIDEKKPGDLMGEIDSLKKRIRELEQEEAVILAEKRRKEKRVTGLRKELEMKTGQLAVLCDMLNKSTPPKGGKEIKESSVAPQSKMKTGEKP